MLAELAAGGALDSTGVFTLSLDRAGQKLAAYRLANPGLFILNLVACAVCSGADRFYVETREGETTFHFRPQVDLPDEALERLFSLVIEPRAPAHLRELALALHGARALPGSPHISVRITNLQGTRELTIEADQVLLQPAPQGPRGVSFRLTHRAQGTWSPFVDRQGANHQVLRHLYHFCRYAPMVLIDNGQRKGAQVTLGVYDPSIFAWRGLRGSQPLRSVAAQKRAGLHLSEKTQSPIASSMVVALGAASTAATEGLLLISRGVAFRRPAHLLGFPMACAVVTADHLEKNLSQSDLVEDANYQALLQAVRAEVDELILEVCANPPAWTGDTPRVFAHHLEQRYPAHQPVPPVVQALKRLHETEASVLHPQGQHDQMAFWRDLVRNHPKQADRFAQGLRQAIARKATRHFEKARWDNALQELSDLDELGALSSNAIRVVTLILAGRADEARALTRPAPQGFSADMAYLLGWGELLGAERPLGRFLAFQRAVDHQQWDTADSLAQQLADLRGTPVLDLWLGWYQLFRKRSGQAATLWERALSQVKPEEREFWAGTLWPELSGKLSFLEQVRWTVRRGLDELQVMHSRSHRRVSGASFGPRPHPTRWAHAVWSARIEGQNDLARELFVQGLLADTIAPERLSLMPLGAPYRPLSPFN